MTRAIATRRADDPPVETEEIEALCTACGYEVAATLTQARPEDPGTHFGAGKVEELSALAAETRADVVAVDGELTPAQTHALGDALPDGTRALDRYRLVLEIFGERAGTRRAQLQVERAKLRYDLPRLREESDEGMLNRFTESGTPLYDVRDRIDELGRKLDAMDDPAANRREAGRGEAFDLLALAGYTNAGKSTLLHRLADDLDLADADPDHPDDDPVAAVRDRLFETLETTTRRATLRDRPVMLTDTVGFVEDLPHWLVRSFSSTLSAVGEADAVVLVADASDPPAELRSKVETSLSVLREESAGPVVTALNKVDLLDDDERRRRRDAIADLAPDPIPVSVTEGTNVDRLVGAVDDRLPTDGTTIELPNCGDAMGLVSWLHDHARVESVEYGPETVTVAVEGRPNVIERARAKAGAIGK